MLFIRPRFCSLRHCQFSISDLLLIPVAPPFSDLTLVLLFVSRIFSVVMGVTVFQYLESLINNGQQHILWDVICADSEGSLLKWREGRGSNIHTTANTTATSVRRYENISCFAVVVELIIFVILRHDRQKSNCTEAGKIIFVRGEWNRFQNMAMKIGGERDTDRSSRYIIHQREKWTYCPFVYVISLIGRFQTKMDGFDNSLCPRSKNTLHQWI